MTVSIRELFAAKGLEIPEGDYKVVESRWEAIEKLKEQLTDLPLESYDISLRNIAGGDQVE
ncbi:MAG TPA: hypothetical protein K8V56_14875 [Sporosarcina psychrophila]|uniref:Uncharacterized protein n=1 Tax=Sporosarcina psychrophila TaxID=1476 RepID=A0A921KEB5_SPOPS|nr:hypothetical protein [Sporosarcina psychrophila]